MNPKDFLFYFVGGTCGSFVKSIFYCYLMPDLKKDVVINPINGDCHGNSTGINHTHWLEDIDNSKKLILIDFDDDDKPTIIRMAVHKVVKYQIIENKNFLVETWGGNFRGMNINDLDKIEKIHLENPDFLIFPDWKEYVKMCHPELTITFKEVLFGDINQKIADYFKVPRIKTLDDIIFNYRNINKKYIQYQS